MKKNELHSIEKIREKSERQKDVAVMTRSKLTFRVIRMEFNRSSMSAIIHAL